MGARWLGAASATSTTRDFIAFSSRACQDECQDEPTKNANNPYLKCHLFELLPLFLCALFLKKERLFLLLPFILDVRQPGLHLCQHKKKYVEDAKISFRPNKPDMLPPCAFRQPHCALYLCLVDLRACCHLRLQSLSSWNQLSSFST